MGLFKNRTYELGNGFLCSDGKSINLLRIIHEDVILPVHMKNEDKVVLSGTKGKELQQRHPRLRGELGVGQHLAQEADEALSEHPGALVLDDPVFHLPEPVLLLIVEQVHYGPYEVLKVFGLLKVPI